MSEGGQLKWFGIDRGLRQGCFLSSRVEISGGIGRSRMGVKIDGKWCGALVDDIVLLTDTGMELHNMLDVVQTYVVKWRMKFNGKKSKVMVIVNEVKY